MEEKGIVLFLILLVISMTGCVDINNNNAQIIPQTQEKQNPIIEEKTNTINVFFENKSFEGKIIIYLKDNKTLSSDVKDGMSVLEKTKELCDDSMVLKFYPFNSTNFISWKLENICDYGSIHLKGDLNKSLQNASLLEDDNPDEKILFTFKDETTNCSLKGKMTINDEFIGFSEKTFNFEEKIYEKFKNFDDAELCMQGSLSSCFEEYKFMKYYSCWTLEVDEDMFKDNTKYLVGFTADINPHRPYKFAKTFFITPDEVRDFLPEIYFKNNTEEDLDYIWRFANVRVKYRQDYLIEKNQEHWEFPAKTIENCYGDCEEKATLLVSLTKAYNDSLKCYVFLMPTHASTFCKIKNKYIIFDQSLKKDTIVSGNDEVQQKKTLRIFFNSYFEEFGMSSQNQFVTSVFDNKEYIEFKDNDEFYRWLLGI